MSKLYYTVKNAFKLFLWALVNPKTLQENNFKMLSDLLTLILKVSIEDRHLMTHIAYVHPEEGEQQIVSIWAGAGIESSPTKRIAELLRENKNLRNKISKLLKQKP